MINIVKALHSNEKKTHEKLGLLQVSPGNYVRNPAQSLERNRRAAEQLTPSPSLSVAVPITKQHDPTKIVVFMKTHLWSQELEKFALKILQETLKCGVDFYILMHTDDGVIYNRIQDSSLKARTLKFSEAEIRAIYSMGFYSMWLSNHWIMMWFYQQFGSKYEYFWSIEHDVRISGNSAKIWMHYSPHDFLYVQGNYQNFRNQLQDCYIGDKLQPQDRFFGFLQLARYSNQSLKYLDECFKDGENGQDELIIYSLMRRGGFTGSKQFLQMLKRGNWTWLQKKSDDNRKLYQLAEMQKFGDHLYIFHPIKARADIIPETLSVALSKATS